MKRELEHFTLDGSLGGQQEWFTEYWMKIGGCGAVTACDVCVYLARNRDLPGTCPFDPWNFTKEDYLAFGERMRPYKKSPKMYQMETDTMKMLCPEASHMFLDTGQMY